MKCRVWVFSALLLATQAFADPFPCPSQILAANEPPPNLNSGPPPSANPALSPGPALRESGLTRPKVIIPLGCARPFAYRAELYTVDSPQAEDAQNLKFFTRKSPEAQRLLNEYQTNRTRTSISGYAGTAGILLALFSSGLGRWIHPRDPGTIQKATALIGAAIAVEGISYSISMLRTNDQLITRAADAYNHDQPRDPVELQFTAGWSF